MDCGEKGRDDLVILKTIELFAGSSLYIKLKAECWALLRWLIQTHDCSKEQPVWAPVQASTVGSEGHVELCLKQSFIIIILINLIFS